MYLHRNIIIILAVLIFTLAAPVCIAADGKVVLVTIGGTSLDEVTSLKLPNLQLLIGQGAIGVANVRQANIRQLPDDAGVGRYSMEGGCVTIGAGTRAAATTDARKGYNVADVVDGRPLCQLYESLYGNPPGSAKVLHLGMNRLWFINSEERYPIEPGALGNTLRKAGLKTAAIGNSDTSKEPRREASVIAADFNGIIDFGDVGAKMVRHDPSAPYGVRTDTGSLIAAFRYAVSRADFIVVDVGDTARAATYAQHCLDVQGAKLKYKALRSADEIIGGILKYIDLSHDRIIIASPNPSPQAVENFDFLTPVIIAGRGIAHGLLTSGSTHRKGIITNADISSSILSVFSIDQPHSFVGSDITVVNGSVADLVKTNKRIILQIHRQPIMRGIAGFLIVYIIVISLYILLYGQAAKRWASWAALLPVYLMLSVLWLPAVADMAILGTIAVLAGLVAVTIGSAWFVLRSPSKALVWVCGAIVITAVADLIRGEVLLRDSIMSYTPVNGARYYGIGNEYMGSIISAAMIGAGFLAAALAAKKTVVKMAVLMLILGIVAVFIGHPSLGANAGGVVSAVAAAVVGLILWQGNGISKKHMLIAGISIIAVLGILAIVDFLRPGASQSHVGRAVHLIASGGIREMLTIIERKVAMNLMLIKNSTWSKLLMASAASVIALLFVQGFNVLDRLRKNHHIQSGAIAATVGTVAALLFNDSGIVAASTAFIYVWTLIVIVALDGQENGGREANLPSPEIASEASPVNHAGQY